MTFCPCVPVSCCDAAGFTFDCNNLKFCPRANPFKDSNGNNQCYCGNLLGGGVSCLADRGGCSGVTVCKHHSDCRTLGTGFVCQQSSCCGGQNICVQQCNSKFPQATPCQQPTPIEPSNPCCNPEGFKFDCANINFCPQSSPVSGNKCYCGNIAGGGVTCLADRGNCTNPTICTRNGDCPIGAACQQSTCCSGQNICVNLCNSQFPQSVPCDQPALPPSCCSQAANFKFDCNNLSFCPGGNVFTDPATKLKCYCGLVRGGVTCFADRGNCTNPTICTKNSDCGAGFACQLNSCCGGQNICVQLCNKKFPQAAECQNPQL